MEEEEHKKCRTRGRKVEQIQLLAVVARRALGGSTIRSTIGKDGGRAKGDVGGRLRWNDTS